MGPNQTEKLLHSKGNQKKKRQPRECVEVVSNGATDKGIICKIYKHFITTQQQNNHSTEKPLEDLHRHFFKEDIWMQVGTWKRSTSLILREMEIITTMRYHLTTLRMSIFSKSTNDKHWRGCGEKGTLLHHWRECKLVQPL